MEISSHLSLLERQPLIITSTVIPPENAKMSTITQRVQTAGVGRLSLGPARLTGSQQPQGKAAGANDLLKVLDPAHRGNYVPSFSLPTPPPSAHASEQGADHPALANVLDLPLPDLLAQAIQHRSISGGGEDESAFFAADLSAVYEAVQLWRNSPIGDRVELFYAVKCNPSPIVLHLLSLLGASFDCASADEINQVLSLPCAPKGDRIIFANPCKPASFVRTAAEQGVDMMTFDNADELHKVRRLHPGAKLVLRILTDDSKSLCRLGLKYGAPLDTCPGLLKLARELDLDVVGVSFHVGSGCKDPMQFADAVWRAKRVFDMGKQVGYEFGLLDIGGGFERETFAEMSEVVRDGLDLYFPKESGVRVIAEPGRFLVSSGTSFSSISLYMAAKLMLQLSHSPPTSLPNGVLSPIHPSLAHLPSPKQRLLLRRNTKVSTSCVCPVSLLSSFTSHLPNKLTVQTTLTTACTAHSTVSCLTTKSCTPTRSPCPANPRPLVHPSRLRLMCTCRWTCPCSSVIRLWKRRRCGVLRVIRSIA